MTLAVKQSNVDWFLAHMPVARPEEIEELKERKLIRITEENDDGNRN